MNIRLRQSIGDETTMNRSSSPLDNRNQSNFPGIGIKKFLASMGNFK